MIHAHTPSKTKTRRLRNERRHDSRQWFLSTGVLKPDSPKGTHRKAKSPKAYHHRGHGGTFHPRVPTNPNALTLRAPAEGWNSSRVQRLVRNLWGSRARTWTRTLTDPKAPGGMFQKMYVGIQTDRGPVAIGVGGVTWAEVVEKCVIATMTAAGKAENRTIEDEGGVLRVAGE